MKDRRRFKRYYRDLPVKLEWEGCSIDGQLMDLSMTGAGCYVTKRIPLYSELKIHFMPEDPFSGEEEMFSCCATVVRCCRSGNEKKYQLGLFFTHLSEDILSRIMDLAYY